jgi:hypothetical protein
MSVDILICGHTFTADLPDNQFCCTFGQLVGVNCERSLERFVAVFGDLGWTLPIRGLGCDLNRSYLAAVDCCAGVHALHDLVVRFVGHVGCVCDPVDRMVWM